MDVKLHDATSAHGVVAKSDLLGPLVATDRGPNALLGREIFLIVVALAPSVFG